MLFEYLRKFLSRHKVCRHVLRRTAVVHIYPLTAHSVRHCKYPAGGKGIRKPGYKPLGIREMRKRIIYHNGVKGFTEVELFNIPANEMNILCLMGFDSDFNHFRRDIHSRYGCDLALEIGAVFMRSIRLLLSDLLAVFQGKSYAFICVKGNVSNDSLYQLCRIGRERPRV